MKLQDLLGGIDLTKTKLIRHNLSNEDVAKNYELGFLETYQSIQQPGRFKDCKYILSFLGTEGTNGKYLGCYEILDCVPFERNFLPTGYFEHGDEDDTVFYKTQKNNILIDLENRLVIDWGKSAISWCQNGTTEKEVLFISPTISDITFTGYDKVLLSYNTLKTIVDNSKEHAEWERRLSSVAGIYLITDTKTGKLYVGSASGEIGGIWGRWTSYAKTGHGGNKLLVNLMKADPQYCYNYQFSILEVFPIKRDKHDILSYEQLYKRKLCSIRFGWNDN